MKIENTALSVLNVIDKKVRKEKNKSERIGKIEFAK